MATVLPFEAVRPQPGKAGLVASRPFEDYCQQELQQELARNPYSFLHIINPDFSSQEKSKGQPRYERIKERYQEFRKAQILIRDNEPCYYIYKIKSREGTHRGIIAAASTQDYHNGVIRAHEDTLAQRELLFKDYLKVVGFNTEPVLLTYEDSPVIDTLLDQVMKEAPEYQFTTPDKEVHFLWSIREPRLQQRLREAFSRIPSLYIADGHHRCASSFLLSRESRQTNPSHTGKEPYNFFMGYLISESNLKIHEYHRLVRDLHGHSRKAFLERLNQQFRIEKKGISPPQLSDKHSFTMYLDGQFYVLQLRKTDYDFSDPLSKLDPYILQKTILQPILGIKDLRNDQRMAYIHGRKDVLELRTRIDSGAYAVGFGMLPLRIDEIKAVADANLTMPPKSTYIEPKLRSGLTIYEF